MLICHVAFGTATESGKPAKHFVNSLGMKMIYVKAEPFDAWTPSMTRYTKLPLEGRRPDVAFALNRPRVPMRVELKRNYFLSEFPVTNRMHRSFVKETGYQPPSGKLVDF